MGYMKIHNLYKDIRILDFKECYALEKIHGTSAHITLKNDDLKFFSGGAKHESFVALFDEQKLKASFISLGFPEITVYGEAHGGKMQKMSDTYGKDLRFIAFEVRVGESWFDVAKAHDLVDTLGLEFVSYARGPATLEWINEQRDMPSSQAIRLGIGDDKMREGVVLRPTEECLDYRGNRIITKHKRDEFKETKTKREVDPEQLKVLEEVRAIADEWVTPMRLAHIMDKMPECSEMKHVPDVIRAMISDVKIESEREVVWSEAVEKAIGRNTVALYKKSISRI